MEFQWVEVYQQFTQTSRLNYEAESKLIQNHIPPDRAGKLI